jgi:hypothetical protein
LNAIALHKSIVKTVKPAGTGRVAAYLQARIMEKFLFNLSYAALFASIALALFMDDAEKQSQQQI